MIFIVNVISFKFKWTYFIKLNLALRIIILKIFIKQDGKRIGNSLKVQKGFRKSKKAKSLRV